MTTLLAPQSANGLRVATCEMPYMESVAMGIWTATGSRHEPSEVNGIAHFIEHLLFKGTSTRDAFAISREIEQLGASIDAFTVEDHTSYQIKGPADQAIALLDVLTDLYQNPVFNPKEVESERNVIHEEIAMVHDVPSQWLEDLLSKAAWGEHPLGLPITGSPESLDAISGAAIREFYERGYCGKQTVFTAAGKIRHDDFSEAVLSRLTGLPTGVELIDHAPASPTAGFAFEESDVEQANLAIGFHSYARKDDRRYALKLLNTLLGENMSSRLFQVLREDKGLCYDVGSEVMAFSDAGLLHTYIALDPENVPAALEGIRQVLLSFVESPPTNTELAAAKSYVIGQGRIALENTSSQMSWAGECLLGYDEIFSPQTAYQRIAAVTAEEVQRVARDIFVNERLVLAGVGRGETRSPLEAFRV